MKTIGTVLMALLPILLVVVLVAGEIKCIVKAINCNWSPVGKAEVIYTGASFTGLGAVVGWLDIKDN